MAAHHRKQLEKMSAPVIAWLIDHGYVSEDCGILDVTSWGWHHLKEARNTASRETMGHKLVPVPVMRERLPIRRERL